MSSTNDPREAGDPRAWSPDERIALQEQTIVGLRAEVNRAVQAIPGRYFRDGEPWEQAIPRLVDEYAAVLRRIRTLDHKFGPFPEVEPLGDLIEWAAGASTVRSLGGASPQPPLPE